MPTFDVRLTGLVPQMYTLAFEPWSLAFSSQLRSVRPYFCWTKRDESVDFRILVLDVQLDLVSSSRKERPKETVDCRETHHGS